MHVIFDCVVSRVFQRTYTLIVEAWDWDNTTRNSKWNSVRLCGSDGGVFTADARLRSVGEAKPPASSRPRWQLYPVFPRSCPSSRPSGSSSVREDGDGALMCENVACFHQAFLLWDDRLRVCRTPCIKPFSGPKAGPVYEVATSCFVRDIKRASTGPCRQWGRNRRCQHDVMSLLLLLLH